MEVLSAEVIPSQSVLVPVKDPYEIKIRYKSNIQAPHTWKLNVILSNYNFLINLICCLPVCR